MCFPLYLLIVLLFISKLLSFSCSINELVLFTQTLIDDICLIILYHQKKITKRLISEFTEQCLDAKVDQKGIRCSRRRHTSPSVPPPGELDETIHVVFDSKPKVHNVLYCCPKTEPRLQVTCTAYRNW